MKRVATLTALAILIAAWTFLWSCSGKKSNPMNTGSANVVITINGNLGSNSYSPNPDTVTVGQTVAWRNSGGTTHTATANAGAFDTGNIGNGSTSSAITMGTVGSFPYHCAIHGLTMAGTLVVK